MYTAIETVFADPDTGQKLWGELVNPFTIDGEFIDILSRDDEDGKYITVLLNLRDVGYFFTEVNTENVIGYAPISL